MSAPVFRDRIKELIRVKAIELMENAGNWRRHPAAQRDSLKGLLEEVGIANAVVAYYSERAHGKLVIIDGHLRRELLMNPEQLIPVLVLDVVDDEADALLASMDKMAALATTDDDALKSLLGQLDKQNTELGRMVGRLWTSDSPMKRALGDQKEPEYPIVTDFNEHYDYVLILATDAVQWVWLQDFLGIERAKHKEHVGIGRVITAKKLEKWAVAKKLVPTGVLDDPDVATKKKAESLTTAAKEKQADENKAPMEKTK